MSFFNKQWKYKMQSITKDNPAILSVLGNVWCWKTHVTTNTAFNTRQYSHIKTSKKEDEGNICSATQIICILDKEESSALLHINK